MTLGGRKMIMKAILSGLFLAAILIAVPAVSQESTNPPAYFLLVESDIAQEDGGDWADAMALTAKAHEKHPEGRAWATYRELTGGPAEAIRFFFPLNRLAELDEWPSNRQVLTETLGKDRARIALSDLDLATESGDSILSYSSKMSRPWPDFQAPKYAWVEEIRIADGKMVEYAALAERVVRIFNKHSSGGYWIVYGNAIGGDSSALLWMYGFDQFAEIDAWQSRLAVLDESLEEGEAGRLVAAMEALSETTTSIWQLEPALSQFEGE